MLMILWVGTRLRRQRLHGWLGQIPDGHGRQIGKAQIQNARRQPKSPPVAADVAQRLQREQDAPGAGAGQAAARGYFSERLLGRCGAEAGDDLQAPRKGLHVAVAGRGAF
jgi:hypothetical protein